MNEIDLIAGLKKDEEAALATFLSSFIHVYAISPAVFFRRTYKRMMLFRMSL